MAIETRRKKLTSITQILLIDNTNPVAIIMSTNVLDRKTTFKDDATLDSDGLDGIIDLFSRLYSCSYIR